MKSIKTKSVFDSHEEGFIFMRNSVCQRRLRYGITFALSVAMVSALLTAKAYAQVGPEVANQTASAMPAPSSAPPVFYDGSFFPPALSKGNGPCSPPGVTPPTCELPWEADYSYLRDPTKSNDFFDPLKFIPFDPAKRIYISFNFQERFRYNNWDNKNGGVKGSPPGYDQEEDYAFRTATGVDLHVTDYFRAYADVYNAKFGGHDEGLHGPPVVYRSDGTLMNAFVEPMYWFDGTKVGLRAGRQEIWLGDGFMITDNAAPSLPSTYMGVRPYVDFGPVRVDAFAFDTTEYTSGAFRSWDNAHAQLWGTYGVVDLPYFQIGGIQVDNHVDPFYMGFRNRASSVTVTNNQFSWGTVGNTGQDLRHDFGARYYGTAGNFDFNNTAVSQFGTTDGYAIRAFSVFADNGYTWHDVLFSPRTSFRFTVASGGGNQTEKTINSYQPITTFLPYWGTPNSNPQPRNTYIAGIHIRGNITPKLSVEVFDDMWWRYSNDEAVYSGPEIGGANSPPNGLAQTALHPAAGNYLGQDPDINFRYAATPHLSLYLDVSYWMAGRVYKAAGGRDTGYVWSTATFKF